MNKILIDLLKSKNREDNLFGLIILKRYIGVAERLYTVTKEVGLIEIIDGYYNYIEKYDCSFKNFN